MEIQGNLNQSRFNYGASAEFNAYIPCTLQLKFRFNPNLEFDLGKLIAMLIQVKHRERSTNFVVTEALIRGLFPDDFRNPIIIALLDIGQVTLVPAET